MKTAQERQQDSGSRIRRWVSSHMTRLIDEWSFNAICFVVFLKLLQFCRLLGAKPTENGWRKVTGIFLKGDIKSSCSMYSSRPKEISRVPSSGWSG